MIEDEGMPDMSAWDEERVKEEQYYYTLLQFHGVEGYLYGISQDLDNLKRLIQLIGPTIVQEEEEFREIEKKEYDPHFPIPSDKVIAAWHKKTYRQFTYKAIFLLIQSVFESGLKDFYQILFDEQRVKKTIKL